MVGEIGAQFLTEIEAGAKSLVEGQGEILLDLVQLIPLVSYSLLVDPQLHVRILCCVFYLLVHGLECGLDI